MIGLLYDIRRVISQQGYYRLDFTFDLEKMQQKAAAAGIKQNEYDDFIQEQLEKIRVLYDQLHPSDSLAHTDDLEISDIGGAMNAQGLGALNSVIDLLRNDLTMACKTIPILMGINNSTSETHANRQWENYMGSIRSCQRTLKDKLDETFTLALRYQGIQDKVSFHFRELSITTAMMQADTEIKALEVIDKALNMAITNINAEGREIIEDRIEVMTKDEAIIYWKSIQELK